MGTPPAANSPLTVQMGLQQHRAGRIDEAEQIYRQLLQQQPDLVDALNLLGALLYQKSQFEEAVTCFQRVLQIQPGSPDALNSVAVALKGQGKLQEAVEYYRQALALRPEHPEVHNNLANALKQQGDLEAAIAAYEQALVLKPDYAEAHSNLGVVLRDLGRLEEAVSHYREAILLKPNYADAHHNLATVLQRQGKAEEAVNYYQQAIALNPTYADACNSLGNLLQQLGQLDAAEAQHRQAIALKPDFAEAHHSLGNVLQQQGNLDAAIQSYHQALALRSEYPEVLNNLGNALQLQGKFEEAIGYYQKALTLRPDMAEACSNLGAILKDQRKYNEAIRYFEQAIALRPNYAEVHNNLGNLYHEWGKIEQATKCYQDAIACNPNIAEIHSNLGNMLQHVGQFEQAFEHFERAIALQPDYVGSYNNLGIALRNFGRIHEAAAAFERAIALQPNFVEALWNRSLTQLVLGDLQQGFAGYEWRFQWRKFQEQNPPRTYPQPRWDGSPLKGRTLFLYQEQGMGDTIHFIRYAALLAQQGERVIVECQAPLLTLLQGVPGIAQLVPPNSPPAEFDLHAPLMSLPYILGTTLETVPAPIPYLTVPTRPFLPVLGEEPGVKSQESGVKQASSPSSLSSPTLTPPSPLRIGIVWTGNRDNPYNVTRTVPLNRLLTLADVPGVQLYSLQKEVQSNDLQCLQAHPKVRDLRQHLLDFVDTAALIQQLDLLISVDTAVTHIAGALGKPVWLLLPFAPDWRWMLERQDTPWYPTMQLFRQSTYGDWEAVLQRVQQALTEWQSGVTGIDPTSQAAVNPFEKSQQGEVGSQQLAVNSQQPGIQAAEFKSQVEFNTLEPSQASRETKKPGEKEDQQESSPASMSSLSSLSTRHDGQAQGTAPISPLPLAPTKFTIPDELKEAARCYNAKRYQEAEAICHQVLQEKDLVQGWHLLGLIAHQQDRYEEAIAHYRRVVALAPDHYETFNNIAVAFQQQGKLDEAIAHYQKSLVIDPTYADAHNNYANALREKGRLDDAIHHYQQAIAHKPNYPDAHNNLGLAFYAKEDFEQAAGAYRQAIALKPDYPQALNHLGNALKELGEFEQASRCYERAIALKPNYAKAFNNWGNVFRDSGDLQTGLQYYNKATELEPGFVEAHWNKALTYLLAGDLTRGFAEYEWRWQVKLPSFQPMRSFAKPLWDGSNLQGKTLFLHAEQGMGDVIQFIRYVHLIEKQGAKIILECHPPLMNLLRDLPGVQQVVPYGSPPPPETFDLHFPLLSLPHQLGITLETVPADIPYIPLPSSSTPPLPIPPIPTLKVGIVWSGNPENPYNRSRAVPVELLLTLADLPDITLYSLQKQLPPGDLEQLQAHPEVLDLRESLADFVDTAVIINQLDLVISIDSAVTHLAGALGKPVWLLLPFAPDWRWMLDREDSPWYPTLRIFRQPSQGSWEPVMEQVRAALKQQGGKSETQKPKDKAFGSKRKNAKGKAREDTKQKAKTSSLHRLASTPQPSAPNASLLESALQHYQSGKLAESEQLCRQILQQEPNQVEALHILGVILCHAKQLEPAIAHFRQVLEQKPDYVEAIGNLASALQEQGKLDEAIAHYQRALTLNPNYVEAHLNLSVALREQDHLEDAAAHCQQAIDLQADRPDAYYNLGFMLRQLGRVEAAIAAYRRAIALQPDFVSAHKNLGHALLLAGDLRQGFAEYEWRWRQENWAARPYQQPMWDGSSLPGKTLLIYAEQGFGDTIQFIRYTALAKQLGARVVVECQPELLNLLQTIPTIDQLVAMGSPLPEFDVHAPMLSLPRILGTTLETIPTQVPYLPIPSRPFLPVLGEGSGVRSQELGVRSTAPVSFKIGIVWAGNPEHKNNRFRSCQLEPFRALADLPGVNLYSLQKGEASKELQAFPELPIQDLSPQLHDFIDTAAAIAQLDLVITVDTAVAHLAGALGKPVWVVLAFSPDWRWMLKREDSPWYPTMRLFRQHQRGDWQGVFERVKAALADEIQSHQEAGGKAIDPTGEAEVNNLLPYSSLLGQAEGAAPTVSPTPLSSLLSPLSSLPTPHNIPIGISWNIDPISDAGLYGFNLALQLLQQPQFKPMLLCSDALQAIPPLQWARLRSLWQAAQLIPSTDSEAEAATWQTGLVLDWIDSNQTMQRNGRHIALFNGVQANGALELVVQSLQPYDKAIAFSTWSAELLRQQGIERVETAYWGIDRSLFHPAPRSNLLGDRFVVLSVGELSYRHGQDLAIAAFKAFHSRYPEALLVTAWSAPSSTGLSELAQTGKVVGIPETSQDGRLQVEAWLLANGIPADAWVDVGSVPYPQMGQLLREANVAVFANRCEFGTNSLAMASLACGIPTILSANTGHLDLIRHNLGYPLQFQRPISSNPQTANLAGWGESDVEEILETLERIYTNQQEAIHRSRIATDFMQDWTWEHQVKQLMGAIVNQS